MIIKKEEVVIKVSDKELLAIVTGLDMLSDKIQSTQFEVIETRRGKISAGTVDSMRSIIRKHKSWK